MLHYFTPEMALHLARLKGISKDLSKTQELVEQVVEIATENEMEFEELEELMDWAVAGNDPAEFYEKEA